MVLPADCRAVLFDRDGTLVVDVPYNGDPALVQPMATANAALSRLRSAGIATGVVSNQSGVARGRITIAQVDAVNARLDRLLGPFDDWRYCPHASADGCGCRKPQPGMVVAACAALGVSPRQTVVIGDIGADVEAARRAGAAAVLVPTAITRPEEVHAADIVAGDLAEAVDLVLTAAAATTSGTAAATTSVLTAAATSGAAAAATTIVLTAAAATTSGTAAASATSGAAR